MGGSKTILINGGMPLLPKQEMLLRSKARIKVLLGAYRSAKTRGGAICFFANCLANPWRPIYGEDKPFSIVVGYTHKVLVDSAYRELKAVIPKEMILKERKSPSMEMELANGHVIKFRTAKGAVEGASACGIWLDEVQKLNSTVWVNYQARASDVHARQSLVLATGLPERGWLEEAFDKPEHRSDPDRLLLFSSTEENTYLQDHVIRNLRATISSTDAVKYLEGRWQPRENLVYHNMVWQEWPIGNLTSTPGVKSAPTHIAMDIGSQSAVVFLQERKMMCRRKRKDGSIETYESKGLCVVDEIIVDKSSLIEIIRDHIRPRGWNLNPSDQSLVFVDPTTRADELANIRAGLFGDATRIIRKTRGDKSEAISYGVDMMRAAICDADGNRRLTFYSGLPRDKRSVLTGISKYHNSENGIPVRDNIVEHALDAVRYCVSHVLNHGVLSLAA